MTRWQREMFERIIKEVCPDCKQGLPVIKEGKHFIHFCEEGVSTNSEETRCLAAPIRNEVAKVYGESAARSLFTKKGF